MESLTDIELVEKAAREGNELAWQEILNRYKYIAYYYSQKIFHVSVDQDDIIQEGLIGIYNAVINYDKSYRIPFKTFAKICVERNIVIFLKTKNRKKHKPLNNYESLFQSAYGEKETVRIMLIDTLQTKKTLDNPEEIVAFKEMSEEIIKTMKNSLTEKEFRIYSLYLEGYSYKEIENITNHKIKVIDNALQRAKRKMINIRKEIEERMFTS